MRGVGWGVLSGLLLAILAGFTQAAPATHAADDAALAKEHIDQLEAPLYSAFIERYMLDELKQLRIDMATQKVELTEKLVDRDLSIGDKAMSYATNTVTYFFYLIAAASSILVIVGWKSIRDIRDKVHSEATKEIQALVNTYEKRLHAIEKQLTQKTQHIDENREEIEKTQELHGLWLRAQQEHSAANKISFYDEILRLRPGDCEALTYKADAILELGEPNWAKDLCTQALQTDPHYGYAHYQMACAYVALESFDEAITSLEKAVAVSESFIEEANQDEALKPLRKLSAFTGLSQPSKKAEKP